MCKCALLTAFGLIAAASLADDVTVTVLNPAGAPAQDYEVVAYVRSEAPTFKPTEIERARTDKAGKAVFKGLPSAKTNLLIFTTWPQKYGVAWEYYGPQRMIAPVIELPEKQTTIKGKVIDPDGNPIAGAHVWVSDITHGLSYYTLIGETRSTMPGFGESTPLNSTSDQNGQFEIDGIPSGTHIGVQAKKEDMTSQLVAFGRVKAEEHALVVLHPEIRARGAVLDGGAPAPNAKIEVMSEWGGWVTTLTADESGKFEFPLGRNYAKVQAFSADRALASDPQEVVPTAELPELTLRLKPTGKIVGRIKGYKFIGVGGQSVQVFNHSDQGRVETSYHPQMDKEGRFSVHVLPGKWSAHVWFTRGENQRRELVVEPGKSVEVEFDAPATLLSAAAVQVVDSRGKAIEGARVFAPNQSPDATNSRGIATLSGTGNPELIAYDRSSGTWGLGQVDSTKKLNKVSLRPAAELSGLALSESGEPLQGVAVTLCIDALQDEYQKTSYTPLLVAFTDNIGRFNLGGLPGKKYKLLYEKEGYQPLVTEAFTLGRGGHKNPPAKLKAGGIAEGVLMDVSTGKPLRGVPYSAYWPRLKYQNGYMVGSFNGLTDESGKFKAPAGVPNGQKVTLHIEHPRYKTERNLEVTVGKADSKVMLTPKDAVFVAQLTVGATAPKFAEIKWVSEEPELAELEGVLFAVAYNAQVEEQIAEFQKAGRRVAVVFDNSLSSKELETYASEIGLKLPYGRASGTLGRDPCFNLYGVKQVPHFVALEKGIVKSIGGSK